MGNGIDTQDLSGRTRLRPFHAGPGPSRVWTDPVCNISHRREAENGLSCACGWLTQSGSASRNDAEACTDGWYGGAAGHADGRTCARAGKRRERCHGAPRHDQAPDGPFTAQCGSATDRQTARSLGADRVVLEGCLARPDRRQPHALGRRCLADRERAKPGPRGLRIAGNGGAHSEVLWPCPQGRGQTAQDLLAPSDRGDRRRTGIPGRKAMSAQAV